MPVFVLSLPRSGSTLLQRVLAGHDEVATAPEPWVALAHLHQAIGHGVSAAYDHETMATAVQQFAERLPGGAATYRSEVGGLLHRLYAAAAPDGVRWFVDKTPRYHLLVDELLALFPESPVLLLWRNPLAVVASMTSTWHDGRWYPYRHGIDLFQGLERLVDAVQRHGDRIVAVRYEDLVTDLDAWAPIEARLGITLEPEAVERAAAGRLQGPVGDPSQGQYDGLSAASLERWHEELGSPVRRAWARRWLDWIGDDRLAVMGYDGAELRAELAALPLDVRRAPADLWDGLRERGRSLVRAVQAGRDSAHEWGPRRMPPRGDLP